MLGIEIIFNVSFESLLPPTEEYEDDNELAKGNRFCVTQPDLAIGAGRSKLKYG